MMCPYPLESDPSLLSSIGAASGHTPPRSAANYRRPSVNCASVKDAFGESSQDSRDQTISSHSFRRMRWQSAHDLADPQRSSRLWECINPSSLWRASSFKFEHFAQRGLSVTFKSLFMLDGGIANMAALGSSGPAIPILFTTSLRKGAKLALNFAAKSSSNPARSGMYLKAILEILRRCYSRS
ncbi:hypothetical protein VTI74DRAFT_3506 [Chaetomium olivicolor]